MSFYLAFKEVWRNKGRFLLFSLVIALITTLVLFIAALAGGLSLANREYLDNLQADLLVFQENSDLLATASQLDNRTLNELRRLEGIKSLGPLGFGNASVTSKNYTRPIDISLLGVEPRMLGQPDIESGASLSRRSGKEAVIDTSLAEKLGVKPGDSITIKTVQGEEDESYDLVVVGLSEQNQYLYQPSIFIPLKTWDRIKSQGVLPSSENDLFYNTIAVELENSSPENIINYQKYISSQVRAIEVADIESSIRAIPGYSVQQVTLNTQQAFTLLIGVLVLGGFFQIQTLQKIPQIGMLKAIGTPNSSVAGSTIFQIIGITVFGVGLGVVGTFLISIGLPAEVPVLFNSDAIMIAIISLLLIGPIGGLVSVRLALKVDPLLAIGQ